MIGYENVQAWTPAQTAATEAALWDSVLTPRPLPRPSPGGASHYPPRPSKLRPCPGYRGHKCGIEVQSSWTRNGKRCPTCAIAGNRIRKNASGRKRMRELAAAALAVAT